MAVIEAPLRAEDRAEARTRTHRVPTLVAASLALLMLAGIGLAAPVAAKRRAREADRVIAAASQHLGARYRLGQHRPPRRSTAPAWCTGRSGKPAWPSTSAASTPPMATTTASGSKGRTSRSRRPAGRHRGLQQRRARGHLPRPRQGHQRPPERRQGPPLQGINIRFTTFIHLGLNQSGSSVASRAAKPTYRKADRAACRCAPSPAARATSCARCAKGDDSRSWAPRTAATGRLDQGPAVQRPTRAGPASRSPARSDSSSRALVPCTGVRQPAP